MKILLKNGTIVNENKIYTSDVLIENEKIIDITKSIPDEIADKVFDLKGCLILPGIIDAHVHFREPGLTYKGDFYSESKAAILGGITTIIDMPNTKPFCDSEDLLIEKINLASQKSLTNFGFFLGASEKNYSNIKNINKTLYAGVKIYMSSSNTNEILKNYKIIEFIFLNSPKKIAIHSESDEIINKNFQYYKKKLNNISFTYHHKIRNRKACIKATKEILNIALKVRANINIMHVSTKEELEIIENANIKLNTITAEICLPHIAFDSLDYKKYGSLIKINPSIKTPKDKKKLLDSINKKFIGNIATDHSPHTLDEKLNNIYEKTPSGIPFIQHSLLYMLNLYFKGKIKIEDIVEKMCHSPSIIYGIRNRGFLRKNYYADIVVVDPNQYLKVTRDNILYKCKWSPFIGKRFKGKIIYTFVNGELIQKNGEIINDKKGKHLEYEY